MTHVATHPAPSRRAELLAEAVVSAYIDEIARSARPRQPAVSVPRRTRDAGHRRAPASRRRPVTAGLGA